MMAMKCWPSKEQFCGDVPFIQRKKVARRIIRYLGNWLRKQQMRTLSDLKGSALIGLEFVQNVQMAADRRLLFDETDESVSSV